MLYEHTINIFINKAINNRAVKETTSKPELQCIKLGVYASSDYVDRTYCVNGDDEYYVYTTKDGEVFVSEEYLK